MNFSKLCVINITKKKESSGKSLCQGFCANYQLVKHGWSYREQAALIYSQSCSLLAQHETSAVQLISRPVMQCDRSYLALVSHLKDIGTVLMDTSWKRHGQSSSRIFPKLLSALIHCADVCANVCSKINRDREGCARSTGEHSRSSAPLRCFARGVETSKYVGNFQRSLHPSSSGQAIAVYSRPFNNRFAESVYMPGMKVQRTVLQGHSMQVCCGVGD